MTEPAHILVVDDDERIRTLLRKFLVKNGYLVSMATDAAHARKILRGLEFDLIVMDVMMPLMDGPTFATEMERRQHDVPIVVLSGSRDIHEIASSMGAAGAILKPFDIEEFVSAVRRALDPERSAAG